MSAIAKFQGPSPATEAWAYENQITCDVAETAGVTKGDALYIDSTGRWKLCNPTSGGGGGATGARAMFYAFDDAKLDEPLTGIKNVVWHYGSGLTPGSKVYLSGTVPGGLDTAPPYTNASPVGYCLSTQLILLCENWQLSN